MVKIIAMDLDRTLLGSNGTISTRAITILKKMVDRGAKIILATSRPPRSVRCLLPNDFPESVWICYNGAEIWKEEKLYISESIPPTIAKEIISTIAQQDDRISILIETDDNLYSNKDGDIPWEYELNPLLYENLDKPIAKILFLIEQEHHIATILKEMYQDECEIVVTDDHSLVQIMGKSVNKANAIQRLLNEWKILFEEVIAFGDDFNDLEMLQKCGIGIAMGNANDIVKEIANKITLTNDEDGVAHELEIIYAQMI